MSKSKQTTGLAGQGQSLASYGQDLGRNQASMANVEEMTRTMELRKRDDEIERLRRRIADLEDFLRGAATQFMGMAGR